VQERQEPAAVELGPPGGPISRQLEAKLDELQASAEGALVQQVGLFWVWGFSKVLRCKGAQAVLS